MVQSTIMQQKQWNINNSTQNRSNILKMGTGIGINKKETECRVLQDATPYNSLGLDEDTIKPKTKLLIYF